MNHIYEAVTTARTHLAIEKHTGRCLGGVGSNFVRSWVFPLYTPSGLTVIQEFPHDHPFHNGFFVGQHPVKVDGREANFWVAPPPRGKTDHLYTRLGRVDAAEPPQVSPGAAGVKFTLDSVWRDEHEEPVLNERRIVEFRAEPDATVCDMYSLKTAAYGALEFPQTKYGSIGIRVEPRLLPPLGGVVLGDGGRKGNADVVHEKESDFVAYENALPDGRRFGVCLAILDGGNRGPWFIRDYGMAIFNPTWRQPIVTPKGECWGIGLRVVAYDGELTEERARAWTGAKPA